jgi:hypothetical protein
MLAFAGTVLVGCGGGDGEGTESADTSIPSADTTSPAVQGNPPGVVDQAPVIAGTPPSQVLAGGMFDFKPTASDADGDVLTFTVKNLPVWATFDPATGRLSGTPGPDDVGSYAGIQITASDGELSATLAAFAVDVVSTATGSATLTWQPPTRRTDGSAVALAGYKVYWGTSSRDYAYSVTLDNPGLAGYVIDDLTPTTWYFAVTAIDTDGAESAYSNEASKQIL